MSLQACAGLGQSATAGAPTVVWFVPLNQPGTVNADNIPVRRGPGLEFEQVATINHDYSITVVGQSGDGKWYKLEIPGYVGDQSSLWIAVDFVTVSIATEMVTMTVVLSIPEVATTETIVEAGATTAVLIPSPGETSEPSNSTCVAPAGWVLYVVQTGDTLFQLAIRTNTSVEQIKLANCLTSNQILTGARVYLPFKPTTNTQIPPQESSPSTSGTAPIAPPSNTNTSTSLPIETATPSTTQLPPDTPSFTDTAVVSPRPPTLGTPSP